MFLTGWKEPTKSSIPMYNIFLSLNSSYVPYGKMFMKSLYDVVDMSKVDKVETSGTVVEKKTDKINENPYIWNKNNTWELFTNQVFVLESEAIDFNF